MFIEIKAVAHQKTFWDHESAIINLDDPGTALRLVNEGADLHRIRAPIGEMVHQPLDGQAAVNNIFHQQHIVASYVYGGRALQGDLPG